MNATIFDSETTGKPINYKGLMSDVDNWPRVSQLAWQKINVETGDVLNEKEFIIFPDGWTIPTEKFFIDNNMSTERCLAEGKPIAEVLNLFIDDLNDSQVLVAHNMAFDLNVVGAEMIRLQVKADHVLKKVCTMEFATDYCQLPGQYGKYKWPKLLELHQKLFKEDFTGAHDALFDVKACSKCFIEMVRIGIIDLDIL